MTYGELCKQVAKECEQGVTYEQVQKIIATMWRIMLEELFINPGEANIMLPGIGQFYMKRKRLNCGVWENGVQVRKEQQLHWCFRFKPSSCVRMVLAGRRELKDLKIGSTPLYFEEMKLKRPKADFKAGAKQYERGLRKKINYDRAELRMAKDNNKKKDLRKRLPED